MPDASVIALTATASSKLRMEIKNRLHIDGCKEFIDNPDRANIKLFLKRVSANEELMITFNWLKQYILSTQEGRQLVFCKSIADTSKLYNMLRSSCEVNMSHVEMFHSMTPQETKDYIIKDMGSINGIIKVLICTNAAGMGVNFKKVTTVTSYGPPQDMDTFVQHIGRAGRNGDQATHLLIFNGRQLRNCEKDVILYAKNNDRCRRELLLAPYGAPASQQDNNLCCDICAKEAESVKHPAFECDEDEDEDEDEDNSDIDDEFIVTDNDKKTVRSLLEIQKVSNTTDEPYRHLRSNAMSVHIIDQIVKKLAKLTSATAVMEHTDITDFKVATDVIEVIRTVCSFEVENYSDYDSDDESLLS